MVEKWFGAVLAAVLARQGVVKLGARGVPLAILDTGLVLVVGAGVLLIVLHVFNAISGALV
jgi:hypothetical protein